jgi:hypothetical protein
MWEEIRIMDPLELAILIIVVIGIPAYLIYRYGKMSGENKILKEKTQGQSN